MSEKGNKLLTTTRLRGKIAAYVRMQKRLTAPDKARAEAALVRHCGEYAGMVPSPPGMCVWCGRGDLNPHDLFRVCGFSYHFGFRRLATRVRGLDYPFTIPRERFRCCPSSLYTFPKISGLGSGLPVKVSPTLSSSTPPVSQTGTQFP